MYQLDVKKAMRLNETHRDHLNASLSMAHDPILGIVTIDSLKMADKPDTSAVADNPPVAGAAGASDVNVAAAVRGIRERALPIVSGDRADRQSGQVDDTKFDPDDPANTFLSGMAARVRRPKKA